VFKIFSVYFDRFEYDATKLLKNNLKNIVKVYSCQELEDKMVFILEYCNGGVWFLFIYLFILILLILFYLFYLFKCLYLYVYIN
jgi:serine/threonine protein kinase